MRLVQETNSPYLPDLPHSHPGQFLPRMARTVTLPQMQPFAWSGLFARLSDYAGLLLENRYTILTMRIVLASVFLLSSLGKLVDITQYSIKPVVEFGILPSSVAIVFGSVLPFIELLCALGLLFGVLTRLASFGIAAMSLAFFSAKVFLLLQGYDLSCGCFGAIVTTFMSLTVYLDPPILLMAIAVMMAPPSARQWISLKSTLQRCFGGGLTTTNRGRSSSGAGITGHSAQVIALFGHNR